MKTRLIETYKVLLSEFENDIKSGIEEGIYDNNENEKNVKFIQEAKNVINEFCSYYPAIFIYIEGGNIQGASASEGIQLNKFDLDDYKVLSNDEEQEYTPESWGQLISEMSNSGEIRSIY
ncbi:hypothetical protein [Chitinophaga niabensis]|uniref:hypothetical protein n=1 Tax=Chitinophaga niabensis TaxID=536979 RepID=UPI0011614D7C|nr:hypothetical protein [Chitinophaga niabensis]